jgi:hypothetical protein
MPFNGSGGFSLVSGNPVVDGTTITSAWANATLADIIAGLSNALCKDGQSTPTADIKFGGFKAKGLAAGTVAGDAVRFEQVFDTGGAFSAALLSSIQSTILNAAYPVGSIYTNIGVSTNPATLLGFGTWSQIEGRFLVGQSTSDATFGTLADAGGSKDAIVVSHTHGITDPSHSHTTPTTNTGGSGINFGVGQAGSGAVNISSAASTTGISINSAGSSGTNANLPPFIVAYMWKRTA